MFRHHRSWACIRRSCAIGLKKFADHPQHAFPGHGQMKPKQLEIARLKREVAKLKAERDILKNVRGSFSSCGHRNGLRYVLSVPRGAAVGFLVASTSIR
jgi:hypothetical protein